MEIIKIVSIRYWPRRSKCKSRKFRQKDLAYLNLYTYLQPFIHSIFNRWVTKVLNCKHKLFFFFFSESLIINRPSFINLYWLLLLIAYSETQLVIYSFHPCQIILLLTLRGLVETMASWSHCRPRHELRQGSRLVRFQHQIWHWTHPHWMAQEHTLSSRLDCHPHLHHLSQPYASPHSLAALDPKPIKSTKISITVTQYEFKKLTVLSAFNSSSLLALRSSSALIATSLSCFRIAMIFFLLLTSSILSSRAILTHLRILPRTMEN